MSELLSGLENLLPHLKTLVLVVGVALALIAAAAATYVLRAVFGPLWRVVQWMFAYTPGTKPGEIVAGIAFGARMLAWAGVIGVVVGFVGPELLGNEDSMSDYIVGQEQTGGMKFGGAVVGTLVIGVTLAVMGIYYFRARQKPPVVIEQAPQVQFIEKAVAPQHSQLTSAEPSPPPAPPPADSPALPGDWDGIWRRERYPLPMIQLSQSGERTAGNFAPNWSGIYPFRNGKVVGESVEFAVADEVFRMHFRLTMIGPDTAEAVSWVTDEDWLVGFANSTKKARTPQQAIIARLALEDMGKRLGKPMSLGVFVRGKEMAGSNGSAGVVPPSEPVVLAPVAPAQPMPGAVLPPARGVLPTPPRPVPHPGQNRPQRPAPQVPPKKPMKKK